MRKIRLGVLGMGPRGITFGIKRFLDYDERAEITAICDRDQKAIDYAVQRTGIQCRQYRSLERMLEDGTVEAVINCTDDPDHVSTALPIIGAGKALYLEKPMAQTIEDCDRIIDGWQKNPVVFMVGLELRYCTLCREMKRIIDRGDIGEIRLGNVVDNVSVGGNYYYHGKDRKVSHAKSLMLEKGTHSLDLANWFVGAHPVRVFCSSGLDVFGGSESNQKRCRTCDESGTCPYFVKANDFVLDYGAVAREKEDFCVWAKEIDVDDNGIAIIDYENGARVSFTECQFTPEYSREFTFVGTQGKMTAFYNNEQEFKITVTRRHTKQADVYYPPKVEGAHGGGDRNIIRKFLDLVEAGRPCAVGVEGARDSAAIAIAAFESNRSGKAVSIPRVADIEQQSNRM